MAFKSRLKIVDQMTIGSPCPDESFKESAKEIDKGWYCNLCCKDVYDLKRMSKKEIANLVKEKNGNFCAVISRRADGSMITKEPVGAANALLSTGLLFASTTLVSSSAVAQTERGDIAPPPQAIQAQVGEIAIHSASSESSSEGSNQSAQSSSSEEVKVPVEHPVYESAGAVYIPERGKVKIEPK